MPRGLVLIKNMPSSNTHSGSQSTGNLLVKMAGMESLYRASKLLVDLCLALHKSR